MGLQALKGIHLATLAALLTASRTFRVRMTRQIQQTASPLIQISNRI